MIQTQLEWLLNEFENSKLGLVLYQDKLIELRGLLDDGMVLTYACIVYLHVTVPVSANC